MQSCCSQYPPRCYGDVKKLKKDSLISEDEEKKYNNDIQKWTDDAIRKVDEQVTLKEKDIMQV